MKENHPTTQQLILFTVIMSFVVSLIGTTLTLGVLGPIFESESASEPFFFNRPQKILERIVGTTTTEVQERVFRADELVVKTVEEASPAVVSVVASKDIPVIERFYVDPFSDDPLLQDFFGGDSGVRIPQFRQRGTERRDVSAGTGFIVSADGMVLTNKHVVEDREASYTVLMNDGRKKEAKVMARDPVNDIAVLKIEGEKFSHLQLGDSSGVKIGQTVIAIGNALGEFRNTVSVGVVSGLHRSVVARGSSSGPETLQELIQTDAAINPGNSGGPLLNIRGEVIAINTAIAQGAENIGFAIPINKAKRDLEGIQREGKITYPFIGVRYTVVTPDLAEKQKLGRDYGALLAPAGNEPAVVLGGPAAKAGLKSGDILLELNGERVTPEQTFVTLIQKYHVGDEVTLKVFRDGKEFEVKVKLEERK